MAANLTVSRPVHPESSFIISLLVKSDNMTNSPVITSDHRGNSSANKGRRFPAEHLTRAEITDLVAALDVMPPLITSARTRGICMTMYRVGIRINECLELRIKDLDFENHSMRILFGKGSKGRGPKQRTVGLDARAVEEIQRWMDKRPNVPPGSPLFCTLKGRKVWSSSVRGSLRAAGIRAGIEKRLHPHMLRHTWAVESVQEGVPIHIIQRQLGHSSLAVTQRYLESIAPQETIDIVSARPDPFTDW